MKFLEKLGFKKKEKTIQEIADELDALNELLYMKMEKGVAEHC